jgi:hypothetical protein
MRFGFVAGLMMVAAGTAGAQGEALPADAQASAQLNEILSSARDKGLPTDQIVAKARQGLLFKSSPTKIVAAAQAVSHRLESAREALGESSTAADINAGQDALSVPGVTVAMLRAIRKERPNRPVVVPVGLLAQLVASGVKPAYASDAIATLVRSNATDAQLVKLGDEIRTDVGPGTALMTALEVRVKALRAVLAYMPQQSTQQTLTNGTTAGVPKGPRP